MSTPDSLRWLKQSVFLNYGAAVLSVIVALFIAGSMQIRYDFQPLTPFLCAVMFSAWLGGVKPGLLAVALSLLAFHHYFLLPIYPSGVEKEIPRLLLGGSTALFIMSLTAAQRSATEKLRESELRLRQIAENIREVFWMATPAMGEVLYVSPAYESIWRQSLESLRQQPQSFFEAIHPEDREHAVGIIKRQREQGFEVEYRIVRPDGSVRWIRDRGFPVQHASGKVCRVAGIAEDITERKKAEEALWRSEQKLHEREELYRILTENANDFIRVHELDGRSIYASPSVVRLYGQEPAHIFQFAHPEDLAICQQWWERILAKGQEPRLWRVRDRDGGWRWMETQGSLVQYHEQPHVMTVCRDVTEWKKAEEALKQADDHLRLVLDTTPALIHTGRPDGYLDYFNERWLKYAGLSLEDLQGWAWTATIHPEDVEGIVNKWRASLASGEPFQHEARVRRADGEYRWMLHHKVPLRDEHGNIIKWYGSSTDIEDRKAAEDALRQRECDLAEAQRVARIGSWIFDIATNTMRGSEEFYRIYDLDKTAFDGRCETILSLMPPDDRARQLQVVAEARSNGRAYEVEYGIKTRSGQQKHIRAVGHARTDSQGAVSSLFGTAQDITELKRAEEAALQNARTIQAMSVQKEEHLRLVIDTIPAMAWSVRPDGVVDFLNQRWLDYSGLSLERYVADPAGPIHPEDVPRVFEKWIPAMAAGVSYEDEMRLRRADGEYRWFLVRTVPLQDEQGNIVKWYGTSTDIQDRKEAEEALQQSEERFAAFMDNLPGYAWMKDLQGRYVYTNQTVRGFPGYDSLGKTDAEIWPADLAAEYRANDQQVIAAKKPLHTVEQYVHEGKQRYMAGSKFPIFDKTGAVALVGGVGVDITERIETEEALRESEQRLRTILRTAMDGFWRADVQGRFLEVNEAYCRMSAYSEQELLAMSISDVEAQEIPSEVVAHIRTIMARCEDRFESRHRRKDGSIFPVEVSAQYRTPDGGQMVAFLRDITERKQAEEALSQSLQRVQALSERVMKIQQDERDRIARELHDELGQTLTALKVNLQMLEPYCTGGEAEGHLTEALVIVGRALEQVRGMMIDVRPPGLEDLGLAVVLESHLARQAETAGWVSHFETLEPPGRLRPELEMACFRVAQEALTNVMRHAHAKEVWMVLGLNGGEVELSVRDDGTGFDVSAVSDHPLSPSFGLIGMRERVRQMGGRLTIRSAIGCGTEVRASFPRAAADIKTRDANA